MLNCLTAPSLLSSRTTAAVTRPSPRRKPPRASHRTPSQLATLRHTLRLVGVRPPMPRAPSRRSRIINAVFSEMHSPGTTSVPFARDDLFAACSKYGIEPLKNMGDGPIYSYRYRSPLPPEIRQTAPQGKEWVILGRGVSEYEFRLVSTSNIVPNPDLLATKLPDATPEIIKRYAYSDEQALLARVRYNRLVDTFFGITAYSLQNHLRTTVESIGQIEIDEIYVGVDRAGRHFIIPVQAKAGTDKIGYAQLYQDLAYCQQEYSTLICRPLSAKFGSDGSIAMLELTIADDAVRIVHERHYDLVPEESISEEDLRQYAGHPQRS